MWGGGAPRTMAFSRRTEWRPVSRRRAELCNPSDEPVCRPLYIGVELGRSKNKQVVESKKPVIKQAFSWLVRRDLNPRPLTPHVDCHFQYKTQ